MDLFYTIVLSIAVLLLILILTYVGLLMKSPTSSTDSFPPTINTCPDYWSVGTDLSSCAIPSYDSKNHGTIYDTTSFSLLSTFTSNSRTPGINTSNNDIVFSDPEWTNGGSSAICSKKKWANQWGILWDGISNYNGC